MAWFTDAPITVLPEISGRLNVVLSFPDPKEVPITENNSEYIVLDTGEPSHNKKPLGTELPAYI
jgi:hypothetical protein